MRILALFMGLLIMCVTTAAGCGTAGSQNEGTTTAAVVSGSSEDKETAETEDGVTEVSADGSTDSAAESENDEAGSEDTGDTGSEEGTGTDGLVTTLEMLDFDDMFTERELAGTYDASEAVNISLNGDSVGADSGNVTVDGTTVTITGEGVYILSGTLQDGAVVVDAAETDKIQIVLNGVSITNDDSACILVKEADKVFITLAEGTENSLSDAGSEYVQQDDSYTVDGVIFCRADLALNGSGSLTVQAGYKHGIVSKKDLVVTGGTWNVTAAGKGMEGENSVRIKDGTLNIKSEDDAIHTDDGDTEGKGFIYIAGGSLTLESGDDGIHAETALVIDDGNLVITGSEEGLEGASVDVRGGNIDITAKDDGINAAISGSDTDSQDGGMNGGNFDPSQSGTFPNEDGSMPQGGMKRGGHGMRGGMNQESGSEDNSTDRTMPEMPEGMQDGQTPPEMPEGMQDGQTPPEMPEGMQDAQLTGQRQGRGGMGGGMMDSQPAAYLRITGGNLTVNSGGDGLDSNGMLYIEGGTIIVEGPTNSGNGALDYGTGAEISGGSIIASGSAGMAETFGDGSSQYSVMYTFDSVLEAGTTVQLLDADGAVVMETTPSKEFQSVIFSAAGISDGTYTVTAGSVSDTVEISGVSTKAGAQAGGMGMRGRMKGQMQEQVN